MLLALMLVVLAEMYLSSLKLLILKSEAPDTFSLSWFSSRLASLKRKMNFLKKRLNFDDTDLAAMFNDELDEW